MAGGVLDDFVDPDIGDMRVALEGGSRLLGRDVVDPDVVEVAGSFS